MSSKFLGETIDIHGGGGDLIFPHHECEIAQAEPLINQGAGSAQKPFSRFWLHTAMVHHQGEKMSKSLGNLVMARDLLQSWSPDALRLYLGGYHYRQVWSHDAARLAWAGQLAERLAQAVTVAGGAGPTLEVQAVQQSFATALDDDLNTPAALAGLGQVADDILAAATTGQEVTAAQQTLREMSQVFGLRLTADTPEARVVSGWGRHLPRFG
jgi:L-cysteine:1D-myo-inositol 2-amino-2-deoxy-alpha-D-glucopyranoside ligase